MMPYPTLDELCENMHGAEADLSAAEVEMKLAWAELHRVAEERTRCFAIAGRKRLEYQLGLIKEQGGVNVVPELTALLSSTYDALEGLTIPPQAAAEVPHAR